MKTRLTLIILSILSVFAMEAQDKSKKTGYKAQKTDEEWKKILTPSQYHIMREKGTERAFTGKYDKFDKDGMYSCAACGAMLYSSENKYNSHCGWPSFDRGVEGNLVYKEDKSHGMQRVEVMCAKCGGHLGHVFDDGPEETTGKRHCINSESMNFLPRQFKP